MFVVGKSHTIKCVKPLSVNFIHFLMVKDALMNSCYLKMRNQTRKLSIEPLIHTFLCVCQTLSFFKGSFLGLGKSHKFF